MAKITVELFIYNMFSYWSSLSVCVKIMSSLFGVICQFVERCVAKGACFAVT